MYLGRRKIGNAALGMLKLLFNLAVPRGRIKHPRECKPRQLDVSLSIQQDVLRLRGGGWIYSLRWRFGSPTVARILNEKLNKCKLRMSSKNRLRCCPLFSKQDRRFTQHCFTNDIVE